MAKGQEQTERRSFQRRVTRDDPRRVVDLLAQQSELSRSRIKEAMQKGAVWIEPRDRRKRVRVRRAKAECRAGDEVLLFYDPALLALEPPEAHCVDDRTDYSVWYKPAGLIAQGTRYGDHCSLMRQVERWAAPKRDVFLVHRLDREARGLMVMAHHKRAAARLSTLFQERSVEKRYRVQVRGELAQLSGSEGLIEAELDGKQARTRYTVLSFDAEQNVSRADVLIETGRLHQIRRHLAGVGYPVLGDPKYGRGNKGITGLRLVAHALAFVCPFASRSVRFALGEEEIDL